MPSSSRLDRLADCSLPYLDELRFFLASYDVRYGSPDDLPTFLEQLQAREGLRNGLCSLIRAVFYREQEEVSPEELTTMLLVAVQGSQIDPAEVLHSQAGWTLSQLVEQAFRSLWQTSQAPRSGESFPEPAVRLLDPQFLSQPEGPAFVPQRVTELDPPFPEPVPLPVYLDETAAFAPHAPQQDSVVQEKAMPTPVRVVLRVWPAVPWFVWPGVVCAVLIPPGIDWLARRDVARTSPSPVMYSQRSEPAYIPPAVLVPAPWHPQGLERDTAALESASVVSKRTRSSHKERVHGRPYVRHRVRRRRRR